MEERLPVAPVVERSMSTAHYSGRLPGLPDEVKGIIGDFKT